MQLEKLSGIPLTMLWTLYHRAAESMREDAILKDLTAEQICRELNFDFASHFGIPDGSIAARAKIFDHIIDDWQQNHQSGTVVELGCGLETQSLRLDNGHTHWLCVDLPESLAWRERLIRDHARCQHLAQDCFSQDWLKTLDPEKPVMISAQGLLMYFPAEKVKALLSACMCHFHDVELVFDILPIWASACTTAPFGLWKTPFYRIPPMPWGVQPSQIGNVLQSWCPAKTIHVHREPICIMRPYDEQWLRWISSMPILQDQIPAVVHVKPELPKPIKTESRI